MPNLMTCKEVADALSVTREHVWRLVKKGRLPTPLYPSPGMPRWLRCEIEAQIERAAAERAA